MAAVGIRAHSAPGALAVNASTSRPTYTVQTIERDLQLTLGKSNELANLTHITSGVDGEKLLMARMLKYCIRMLHADGWHPPTVIRAIALKESGDEGGMRGTMYRALRERRKEAEDRRDKKHERKPNGEVRANPGRLEEEVNMNGGAGGRGEKKREEFQNGRVIDPRKGDKQVHIDNKVTVVKPKSEKHMVDGSPPKEVRLLMD